KLRLLEPAVLIDLSRVPNMRGVREEGGELVIGAMTAHADVAASEIARRLAPVIAEAAGATGDVQVRNRGTIGGSAAHADPNADYPVALLASGARLTLRGPHGSRTVAVEDFFVDLFTTALEPNEILTEIRVPAAPVSAYAKFRHPASGYVVVSCGVVIRDEDVRVAIGGLAGKPIRAGATEQALAGKPLTAENIAAAAALAAEGTEPDGDLYADAGYKRQLATVFARRALETAAARDV